MILVVINIICLAFTVTGALILGNKGDKIYAWVIYTIAAVLGIIYFACVLDPVQIVLWAFFLVNDLLAIRRIRKHAIKAIK